MRHRLGLAPCQTPTGVTTKGLATVAYHCLHLSTLHIHFQVTSHDLLVIPRIAPGGEPTIPREDCALTDLEVGKIPVTEESTLVIASTLLRLFPHISRIMPFKKGWRKVMDAINLSKQIADPSSKNPLALPSQCEVDDNFPSIHT